ncbi:MAG: ATP-grasp domain-containing protein [Burkholderiales bacterium]|nr:ATP-grasp domain-containing protein [Burkholderiales bacterium]
MIRIVISSVGSLVGQNILDSLHGRRDGIEVVGINSTADAASNFRCDRAYLAPPAASGDAYLARLSSVLGDERPDLVLPGRDDDVLALAQFKEARPQLAPAIPVGPSRLARILGDKWASREFAGAHALPYADSAPADDAAAIGHLLARHGYPLVAKPRRGNGSRGVRIVYDERQLAAFAALPDYLLQPYLEPEAGLTSWRELARDGTPLFHAPALQQIACQAVIGPDRRIRGLLCTVVELVMGRLERTWRLDERGVDDVARRYAEAFAAAGWVGALNLQGRRDGSGVFNVYELNGRLTGGTTARLHLGFDELGMLIEAFTGHRLPPRPASANAIVTKSLTEFAMLPADIERLQADGRWQSGTPDSTAG